MSLYKMISVVFTLCLLAEAKSKHHARRNADPSICNPMDNTNKIKCFFCTRDGDTIKTAECSLVSDLGVDDPSWQALDALTNLTKLTFSSQASVHLKYIPTNGIKNLKSLHYFEIKYNKIQRIQANAFVNLSGIEEIKLRNNHIQILEANAFNGLTTLKVIGLDKNSIVEINRDVFYNLPELGKLFLTDNNITTLHDRAFIHLNNLTELEINMNNLFSLNNETFTGLTKLQSLDLSRNALEVIGDNTFLPLNNLLHLSLDSNKIQMLDEKAFNGLQKLQSLSLSRNKLKNLDNIKLFETLTKLVALNLKGNEIVELKPELLSPILNNFYSNIGELEVDENNFPCDCRLDWSLSIINNTLNRRLKTSLENLKCYPDPALREQWNRTLETDKETSVEEKEPAPETDYEYYDESQMNGQLFYTDVRHLLNCSNTTDAVKPTTEVIENTPNTETKPKTEHTTQKVTKTLSSGTTYLIDEMTQKDKTTERIVPKTNNISASTQNKIITEPKANSYTTIRLSTVSARPDKDDDRSMSADEAKPETGIKKNRSVKEDLVDPKGNYANKNYVSNLILLILCVLIVH